MSFPAGPTELFERALASHRAGDVVAAEQGYTDVIRRAPSHAAAHTFLGRLYFQQRAFSKSLPLLEQACRLDPQDALAHYSLGLVYGWCGRPESAVAVFDQTLIIDPVFLQARFARTMAHIPMVYATRLEIDVWRSRYSRSLAKLAEYYATAPSNARCAAAEEVGTNQPYFLPYQAKDDRKLQEAYGQLICSLMAERYPHFAETPPMPPNRPGERLRLGILSAFFRDHSNWKMPIRGWIENIDRSRFSVFGYYAGGEVDGCTVAARTACDHFVSGTYSVEEWAHRIRGDALHALLIPGLGMDVVTGTLAALRLAPVQCNAVGHPVTSGMPTLDYYLSSELMEPAGGDVHYSEKLVRLPNLGVHYRPARCEPSPFDLAALGVRDDAIVYLCCQSLYKYLPGHDEVFSRIARAVPAAQFVFIRHRSDDLTRVFTERLERSFAASGKNWVDHCIFVPRLSTREFNAVMAQADIFLDTPDWNGMNTVMEALPFGIPIVTLPGTFMRGRHAAAILRMIGVTETIASSLDDYVDFAVRLGKDLNWRRMVAERITRHKAAAYADMSCVEGLQAFLDSAIARQQ